jgi:hypothetical protein
MARPTGALAPHPYVSRRSAHPSMGVSEAKRQSPDAEMRARERVALFEIVKNAAGDVGPHPEERARENLSANSNVRAHRSAVRQWNDMHSCRAAMLLSTRARRHGAFWRNEPNCVLANDATRRTLREEPTCTCGRPWCVACALFFTMKIPTGPCGPFASAREGDEKRWKAPVGAALLLFSCCLQKPRVSCAQRTAKCSPTPSRSGWCGSWRTRTGMHRRSTSPPASPATWR